MVQLVAIECSTNSASVALLHGGDVSEHRFPPDSRQSDALLSGIDTLIRASGIETSQLDAVAVAVGPGAFTGVRLAIAAAQGLALAWAVPVIPVSTLEVLASQAVRIAPARHTSVVLAVLDARMGEIYGGWFRFADAGLVSLGDAFVIAPAELSRPAGVQAFVVVGEGFATYERQIVEAIGQPVFADPSALPTAADVARIAVASWPKSAQSPESIEAAYLRNKVALTSRERAAAKEDG